MAINVADNFSYLGGKPLDARVKYDTVANMVAVPAANLYDGCLAYVTGTKKNYQYDSSNISDSTLGKWRELQTGGGGGTDYTAGDGIDITEDVISTKQSEEGDIDEIIDVYPQAGSLVSIVNAFNRGDIYSTDEKMIGQWIDGKPLYQKVVSVDVQGTASRSYIDIADLTSLSIDTFVDAWGRFLDSSASKSLTLADQNNRLNLVYGASNSKKLQVLCYDANFKVVGYAIIQYTKTTDTAISIGSETEYSTDEKVVGTWVDGKPLYQKTVEVTPTSAGVQIATDVDTFINAPIITRKYESGSSLIITNCGVDGTHSIAFQLMNNILYAVTVSSSKYSAGIAKITVQYTKTTT